MLLGLFFGVRGGIEGPVVLIRRRRRPPLGHRRVALGPLAQAPFRARRHQPVRRHREHRVGQRRRAPPRAHGVEEPAQAQPLPQRPRSRHAARRRRPLRCQSPDIDALATQMRLQSRDDAPELARAAQSGHLPQPQQRPVRRLGALADRFHQRQVLVRLVAPSTPSRLHEHSKQHNACCTKTQLCVAPTFRSRKTVSRHKTTGQRPTVTRNSRQPAKFRTELAWESSPLALR